MANNVDNETSDDNLYERRENCRLFDSIRVCAAARAASCSALGRYDQTAGGDARLVVVFASARVTASSLLRIAVRTRATSTFQRIDRRNTHANCSRASFAPSSRCGALLLQVSHLVPFQLPVHVGVALFTAYFQRNVKVVLRDGFVLRFADWRFLLCFCVRTCTASVLSTKHAAELIRVTVGCDCIFDVFSVGVLKTNTQQRQNAG